MNNSSYRVALGGIISSLCLLAMFLTGVFPILYLTLPMIAGALLLIINNEINSKWAFLTYMSVSFISAFVTFDKEAALIFILFFGHYPIIKQKIEKIDVKLFQYILKLSVYNICAIADFYITTYIFGITDMLDDFSNSGKYASISFLIISNFIFLLYDYSLSVCFQMYIKWFRPKILRKK